MHTNSASPIALTGSYKYYSNIPYDKYNRTTIDMFVPTSATPVGVLLHFHGGGFVVGRTDPSQYTQATRDEIQALLDAGVAFAYVNYRLVNVDGERNTLLKSLYCGAKAIAFMKQQGAAYNLDVTKMGLQGSSAGNGLIMQYLHDVNDSVDCVAMLSPQATYDPLNSLLALEDFDIIEDMQTYNNSKKTYLRGCGIKNIADLERADVVEYRAIVDYIARPLLGNIGEAYVETLNDPTPLENNPTLVTHHFRNCISIHNKFTAYGITSNINIPTAPAPLTEINPEAKIDFLIRRLGA